MGAGKKFIEQLIADSEKLKKLTEAPEKQLKVVASKKQVDKLSLAVLKEVAKNINHALYTLQK